MHKRLGLVSDAVSFDRRADRHKPNYQAHPESYLVTVGWRRGMEGQEQQAASRKARSAGSIRISSKGSFSRCVRYAALRCATEWQLCYPGVSSPLRWRQLQTREQPETPQHPLKHLLSTPKIASADLQIPTHAVPRSSVIAPPFTSTKELPSFFVCPSTCKLLYRSRRPAMSANHNAR